MRQAALAPKMEGALRPYVPRQTRSLDARVADRWSFQNLLHVSGPGREQEYEIRKLTDDALLLRGGLAGEEPEIVPAGSGSAALGDLHIRSEAFYLTANELVLPGSASATWQNEPLPSGRIPERARSGLSSLLLDSWND